MTANFQTVGALLEADGFIAAKVLAMAEWLRNQPHAAPLKDLEDAVRLTGMRQVETIVLSVMLVGPMSATPPAARPRQDVWAWTFGCAVAAGVIGTLQSENVDNAAEGGEVCTDAMHLIDGLLLGLGTLVLLGGLGWTYAEVLGSKIAPATLADHEQDSLGVTHHRVTAWVLQAMGCRAELGGYSRALDDRDAWDHPKAIEGHCIELLGAWVAGQGSLAGDRFLGEHLPSLGLDYQDLLRQHGVAMKRRVEKLLDIFDAPAPVEDLDEPETLRRAGHRLDRIHRLHSRRGA